MQSQSESSYPSLDRVPRAGLQALDLNSQADEFSNLATYSDILAGRSGRTLGLRPPRHGAARGRGQEVFAGLGRGQEVFAGLGRGQEVVPGLGRGHEMSAGLGRGLGRGQPMPAASGSRRRRTPTMVAAAATNAVAAAVGEAVGGAGGSRTAAGRGAGGGRGGRPRSQVSGRGGGSRRSRTPISQPDHSINVEDDDEEDEGMDEGGQLRFSKKDDADESSEGSCDGFSSEDEMGKMIFVRRQKRQRQFLTWLSLFGTYHDSYMVKGPRRTAVESGLDWVQNTLQNRTECYNMFRMNRTLFEQLHTILVGGLAQLMI
ncbi:unnamed protein product [Urochloa humidicola]